MFFSFEFNSFLFFLFFFFSILMLSFFIKKFLNFSMWGNKMINIIFILILVMNFISLIPFSLGISSLSFNLILSFFLWSSMFFYYFFLNFKKNSVMFLPVSTPYMLVNFLIGIEMISIFMRPISLSVRLMSNLTASHLMMHLLFLSVMKFKLVILFSFFFLMFEFFVAFIQSYIFSILLTIYYNELVF